MLTTKPTRLKATGLKLVTKRKLLAVSVALFVHAAYADEPVLLPVIANDTPNLPQSGALLLEKSTEKSTVENTGESTAENTEKDMVENIEATTKADNAIATKATIAIEKETKSKAQAEAKADSQTASAAAIADTAKNTTEAKPEAAEKPETEKPETETTATEKTAALIIPKYQARKEDQALESEKKREETANEQQDEAEKPKDNYFKRLYQRYFGGEEAAEVEKIVVAVNLVNAALAENVQAALAEITVEEFSDFKSALPRIRAVARDAAQAVGYYNVDFVFKKQGDSFMDVTITANEPVKITKTYLKVQGGEQANPIKKLLDTHKLQVGKTFNHRDYEQLKQQITQLAKQMGFFDAAWQTANVTVQLPENTADITLVFHTGKRYRFGDVVFLDKHGKPYASSQIKNQVRVDNAVLRQLMPFKQGDLFEQKKITQYANNLLNTQYFNAVDIDVRKPKVKKLENALKSTVVFSQTEQPADSNTVLATQVTQTTEATQADQKTTVPALQPQPMLAKEHYHIPILVTLDSSKPNTAELGLGYGTDTGMRMRGKLTRNLFNQKGHQVRLSVEASKIKQAITTEYEKPFKDPLNDTVTYFVGYEREKRDSGIGNADINIDKITTGVQRNVQTGRWRHTFSLSYYLDKVNAQHVSLENIDLLPAQFHAGKRQHQLLLLGYRLGRTHLRGGLHPYRGVKQYYQVEVGAKEALSDTTLAIFRAGISGLYSFGDNRDDALSPHQVVGRVDAASIVAKNFIDVPYNQRFFAGGDRSIRGYDYKSLSPQNANGFLVGGKHFVAGSAEYSYLVADNWRTAVFADVGNAYNATFSNGTKLGAGVGLRWLSPVGLVRVDLAAGVSEKKPPIRLHFFIGPPL